MKGTYTVLVFILLIAMIVSPLRFIESGQDGIISDGGEYFRIKQKNSEEIVKVSAREYLIGVLAGEMSPDTEKEALKAQAVAAYTYALYKKSASIDDFDLTADPNIDQSYISTTEQVSLWQDSYDKNRSLIEEAVDAVFGIKMLYNGEPIYAAYHSVSAGKTENASDIFGKDYPYLVSVESAADLLSPSYLSSAAFKEEEFADKLLDLGVTLVGEKEKWLGEAERTDGGYVKTYTIMGKKIKGTDIRRVFSLNSTNFDLEIKDEMFIFTTRGCGHAVGMSQYGAVQMAKEGSSWKEILNWYYKNTEITEQ